MPMGFLDRLFGRQETVVANQPQKQKIAVGADKDNDLETIQSFNNSNFTFSGELNDFDYVSILRNKQDNIQSIYQLVDYFTDADPIIHGIIKHVYVPFSTCSDWYLTGSKKKTYALYEEQYKRMRLREKIDAIFLELWKYYNVCCYLYNGDLITLPIHKWKIGNTMFNGTPIVDYDCQSIINEFRTKSYAVTDKYVKDSSVDYILKGYPEEIQKAVKAGQQYAQLNPENTFVLQCTKESWQRYAIPFITSCLRALAKKELISSYEDAMLNIGKRSFVHVQYGESSKTNDILPDKVQLTDVRRIFLSAMSGTPLAVTNHLAKATPIQFDLDDLFQWNKYRDVNNDILAAGGISGILVTGVSEDGSTFASAQVSMETAEARINSVRDEFCEMMTKINKRLAEIIPGTYNLKETPEFHFQPLTIEGKKALREKAIELWEKGVVSTEHMLNTNGYSLEIERENRVKEKNDGTDKDMAPRDMNGSTTENTTNATNKVGRPEKESDERTSDPEKTETGKQPKPSNPEGSEDTES
jgi:hypothetical protein